MKTIIDSSRSMKYGDEMIIFYVEIHYDDIDVDLTNDTVDGMEGKSQKDQELSNFENWFFKCGHHAFPLLRTAQSRTGDKYVHDEISKDTQSGQAVKCVCIAFQTVTASAKPAPDPKVVFKSFLHRCSYPCSFNISFLQASML